MLCHLLPSLVVATAALAGCGGDGDDGHDHDHGPDAATDALELDAPPRQVIMETHSLVATEIIEGIFTGGPSDHAVIHLEAPVAELDWNIHGHENGGTQTVYEELNKMTVDYVFTPSSQTDWWLLLRNSGPIGMPVQVRLELYGNMQWRWE